MSNKYAIALRVYSGRLTQPVRDQFTEITQKALKRFLNESINERLKSALESESSAPAQTQETVEPEEEEAVEEGGRREIRTTEDEIEAFFVVKSVLREVIDVKRVHMRDTKSYCGILLDDNNRKPICRLHFNWGQKYVGVFDENRQEERLPIDEIDEMYQYADRLIATVKQYDGGN